MTPEQLENLGEDDLFAELGEALTQRQALPTPKKVLADKGRRWFAASFEQLRQVVCPHWATKTLMSESDVKTLTLTIADLIAGHVIGVPPITVASIVVKIGLHRFCASIT